MVLPLRGLWGEFYGPLKDAGQCWVPTSISDGNYMGGAAVSLGSRYDPDALELGVGERRGSSGRFSTKVGGVV